MLSLQTVFRLTYETRGEGLKSALVGNSTGAGTEESRRHVDKESPSSPSGDLAAAGITACTRLTKMAGYLRMCAEPCHPFAPVDRDDRLAPLTCPNGLVTLLA